MNQLQKAVRDYLTMRRGLGFKLVRHEAALREFVLFLARKRSVRITVNLALEWATQDANHEPYEWAARLSIVRGSPGTGAQRTPRQRFHRSVCFPTARRVLNHTSIPIRKSEHY
jgi:hypothetical protein